MNQSEDADRGDESPLLHIWSDEQKRQKAEWQAEIERLEQTLRTPTPELQAASRAGSRRWLSDPACGNAEFARHAAADPGDPEDRTPEQRDAAQKAELTRHFLSVAEELKPARDRLEILKKQLAEMKPATTCRSCASCRNRSGERPTSSSAATTSAAARRSRRACRRPFIRCRPTRREPAGPGPLAGR